MAQQLPPGSCYVPSQPQGRGTRPAQTSLPMVRECTGGMIIGIKWMEEI